MVTLSTAEAELLAIIDGSIAMKGVEALLLDMDIHVEEKQIASDSTAALSISTGSSSWRTRHLKIKSAWLQEQISHGIFTTRHCPGERQPADLLTKALSSARMSSLLQWWRFGDVQRVSGGSGSSTSSRMLVAMVCCLLVVSARATEQNPHDQRGQGIQFDWDMAGMLMVLLMLLGALMVWEGIRWSILELYHEWMPGASKRKLKRLKKLQEATTRAIERELQRLQREAEEVASSAGTTSSSSTSGRRQRRSFGGMEQEAQGGVPMTETSTDLHPPQQQVSSSSPGRTTVAS